MKLTKNKNSIAEKLDRRKEYSLEEAVFLVKELKYVQFDESVDIAILQVNEKDLPNEFLSFADNSPLIGDDVYALGHGMSQVWSLTKGI